MACGLGVLREARDPGIPLTFPFPFHSLSQWDTKRLCHNLPGRGNPGILRVSAGKAGRGTAGVMSVERSLSLLGSILNPSSSSGSLTRASLLPGMAVPPSPGCPLSQTSRSQLLAQSDPSPRPTFPLFVPLQRPHPAAPRGHPLPVAVQHAGLPHQHVCAGERGRLFPPGSRLPGADWGQLQGYSGSHGPVLGGFRCSCPSLRSPP